MHLRRSGSMIAIISFNRGWKKLWIEPNSTYVVTLISSKSTKIPSNLHNCWIYILHLMTSIQICISHIYRQRNGIKQQIILLLFLYLTMVYSNLSTGLGSEEIKKMLKDRAAHRLVSQEVAQIQEDQ